MSCSNVLLCFLTSHLIQIRNIMYFFQIVQTIQLLIYVHCELVVTIYMLTHCTSLFQVDPIQTPAVIDK